MGFLKIFNIYMPKTNWMQTMTSIGILIIVLIFIQWIVARLILQATNRALILSGYDEWNKALIKNRVYQSIWYAVPFCIISIGIRLIPHINQSAEFIGRIANAGVLICLFITFGGTLSALQDMHSISTRAKTRSIKGYIQIGQLILVIVCTILVLSILIGRSPLWMISGLGALSAVLLLVFKDTLLSLVASTQLTTNDMLRIGDWIQMPQSNADGFVRDIALHTVKVQNLDNTVTTVPTYKLFSESYRNYRQMFESGGRRIKRTLLIDATSIRFLGKYELRKFMELKLLSDYLTIKKANFIQSNNTSTNISNLPENYRRLTNIGIFRAYALAYLKEHSELRKDMTMMVRMMEPKSDGIPIEIYCFTALTALVEYERIQGDIFDYLLAILPELGLYLYQKPSGTDFCKLGKSLQELVNKKVVLDKHF